MKFLTTREGHTPLVLSIPHAGRDLPDHVRAALDADALSLPDTDWHVDRLYGFATELDLTVVKAEVSRYAIDLNRDPAGESLYPGADVTEICPTTSFAGAPIYQPGQNPSASEINQRVTHLWQPYHHDLALQIKRVKALHGYCILWDAHSIASHVPRFFEGKLPDLNWGTNDGATCDPALQDELTGRGDDAGFTEVVNGRFRGGYITRHYGDPQSGVHAVQLEIGQAAYLDEAEPDVFDEKRAEPLITYLRAAVHRALAWWP